MAQSLAAQQRESAWLELMVRALGKDEHGKENQRLFKGR